MKVLCASWHYPPSNEICGKVAYRFARALAARGHEVTVVTIPLAAIRHVDPDYGADVPGVRVVRVAPWPGVTDAIARRTRRLRHARFRNGNGSGDGARVATSALGRWLRDMRQLPDRAMGWIVPARRAMRALAEREHPDVLLTHSPHLSAHVAALGVHSSAGIPWWAWLHDPLIINPYHHPMTPVRQRVVLHWRGKIARHAAGLCAATDAMSAYLGQEYGVTPVVLRSGYDPHDLPSPMDPPDDGPMVMIHAGTLYGHRTPIPILEAIAMLRRGGEIAPGDLVFRVLGDCAHLGGESPSAAARRLGIDAFVRVEPPVSQREAFEAIATSHVGVVLAEGQPMQVPAKMYELIGMHRPILALADGETAVLVERHRLGCAATRSTLADALRRLLAAHRQDHFCELRGQVAKAAAEFTIQAQAERFEQAVTAVTPRA